MAEPSNIGPLAADLMDQIERDHPGAQIGEVGIVVEILHDTHTVIEAKTTEHRAWVAAALFRRAATAIDRLIQ